MVKNVTSYSGNGLRDWLVQRVSAVVLAIFTLLLLGCFLLHPDLDYVTWHTLFQNLWVKSLTLLVLLCLVLHAWIGVWTIFTDYLKCACVRIFLSSLVVLALVTFFIWGFFILWSV